TDQSEMLQFSDRIKKLPLQVTQVEGEWIISTQDGIQRALINIKPPVLDRWSELLPDPQETLDLRLYPDGKREIRLAAYDHFSPPRYDALPLAFWKRNGMKERATLSFESKPRVARSFIPFRSEEHTSELQSRFDIVCRLLLENKKRTITH